MREYYTIFIRQNNCYENWWNGIWINNKCLRTNINFMLTIVYYVVWEIT